MKRKLLLAIGSVILGCLFLLWLWLNVMVADAFTYELFRYMGWNCNDTPELCWMYPGFWTNFALGVLVQGIIGLIMAYILRYLESD